MKLILNLFRIIVGVLFIFSGLIKANDPLGLSYKMDEFFEVLHLYWLVPYSLVFSILMNAFEIIAGVAVLVGYRMRIFSTLLLVLIIFFTFLTGFALFSGLIKECGCFGDCIKLEAKESFWKDVILTVMIVVIFIYNKQIKPLFSAKISVIILALATVFSFGIQWYTLKHLPIVDCLPFKVGNNIPDNMKIPAGAKPDVYKTVLIYKKDGKEQSFTEDNYPWQDSTWEYVDRKDELVQKGNAIPPIKDFALKDFDGGDFTQAILSEGTTVYLFLVKNVEDAGSGWENKIKSLEKLAAAKGFYIYGVTSSSKEAVEKFKQERGITFPFMQMDGTTIKTAGRANPTLMELNKGTITGKWHYNDIPTFSAN
ncbi:DoxX family membrane protein [Chitinophaga sedimenti]|uniref:BT_3928 family protein n=1 Tax=Chitinophaga sedimenti TaxID=2033606 RepID=UPI002004DC79|nr:BT_3928 family protein [Chitinophaga sedimenti]MCK7555140.1 DoxX family membrane protein [Chitinophaga sedimenti]